MLFEFINLRMPKRNYIHSIKMPGYLMQQLYSYTNYQKHACYYCQCKIFQHSTYPAIKNIHHRKLQLVMGLVKFLKLHKRNIILMKVLIERNILNFIISYEINYLKVHMFNNRMLNRTWLLYNLYSIDLQNRSRL